MSLSGLLHTATEIYSMTPLPGANYVGKAGDLVQTASNPSAPAGGFPYEGEDKVAPGPNQIPVAQIASLLTLLDSGDRNALLQAYVSCRPKAGPYMAYVVANPGYISIAADGGGDHKRNEGEAALYNLLVQLLNKYGVSQSYTGVQYSPSTIDRALQAGKDALASGKDAAVSSLTGSAIDAGMPSVQRNAARQASNNMLWIGLGIVSGLLVAKAVFK